MVGPSPPGRGGLARMADSPWAHTPTEAFTVSADDGVALHVEIDAPQAAARSRPRLAGPVPTVVLVHGFALSMQCWVLQRRALLHSGYRVVAYDQRGHGRSGQTDVASCTIEQLGRDLAAVLQATCPTGPIVLIGHSMGGMSVMSYVVHHPDAVRDRTLAVALVSTSAGGKEVIEFGLGTAAGEAVGAFGSRMLTRLARHDRPVTLIRRLGKGVQNRIIRRWAFDSPVSPGLVDFVADMVFDTSFDVMAAFLPAVSTFGYGTELEALHGVEVLVLGGSGDLVTPPSHSEAIVRRIPGAEHVVVEDAGHLVMLEHPRVVTQQLLMLIARAQRALSEGVAVGRKPRVRRTIQDISKRRRDARARRARRGGREAAS